MKPFLTIEQQIHMLREDKRLLIADEDFAAECLKSIGYFALIGGYKAPFKDLTTGLYKTGTRFEDIFALYEFDENLRELFLRETLINSVRQMSRWIHAPSTLTFDKALCIVWTEA
jgi:abortive infection bacteriophage resistance protein